MPETDRQTDKTTRWAMTVYEDQWPLLEKMPEIIAEWGWQDEKCPDTGRLHKQGYFRTFRQFRFTGTGKYCKPSDKLREVLPGIHIENARDWNKLLNYCKKVETSLGNQVHQVSTNTPMTMAETLIALAEYRWTNDLIQLTISERQRAGRKETTYHDIYKDEYWDCVNKFLQNKNRDNSIGLFTNNQMLLGWVRTRQHWISRAYPVKSILVAPAESDSEDSE